MRKLSKQEMAALEKIREASPDNKLHVRQILKAAKIARHPLHKRFEWNDAKAAEKFRLDQARQIVEVYVTSIVSIGEVRAYVSVASDRTRGGGYTPTEQALASEVTRNALLDAFKDELAGMVRRHQYLRHLAPSLFATLDALCAREPKQAAG